MKIKNAEGSGKLSKLIMQIASMAVFTDRRQAFLAHLEERQV
ncbi:hypothetical protein SD78_2169 [Bacillus badius]|nr:hypothetical protein SD78_2169 [Bacillus badius]